MTLDRISQKDGVTQTMLLAENTNSQYWSGYAPGSTIASSVGGAALINSAFGISLGGSTVPATPPTTWVSGTSELVFAGSSSAPLAVTSATKLVTQKINYNRGTAIGSSPVPSSNHPGSINVFFCDGHGQSISDGVDSIVYAYLLSSGGVKRGQAPLGDDQF
jgi:prepilin-type processing-associated H-X9-DG protein